jgi:hypothetical protein
MNRAVFYGAIVLGVIFSLLGVYYLIHGIYHPFVILSQPFTLINHPPVNYYARKKYSVLFFAVAILFFFVAFLTRPKKSLAAS